MLCVIKRDDIASQLFKTHPSLSLLDQSVKGRSLASLAQEGAELKVLLKQREQLFLDGLYAVLAPLHLSPVRTVMAEYLL